MLYAVFEAFLILAIGHYLADYPLQGDFMAKAKNHRMPIPGVPFYQPLIAHAAIQGGFVWAITGRAWMGVIEFFVHGIVDYMKCDEVITFSQDQTIHLACKLFYAIACFAIT